MRYLKLLAGALVALAVASPAMAEDYPTKPVTILVGLSPGGTVDTIARLLASQLEEKWKQPVVVENKPGGGGGFVLRELVSKPADGYTLVMGASPTQVFWIKDTGFTYDDLDVVSVVGKSYYNLMVNNDLGIKTMDEFQTFAKEHPEKLNIGVIPSSAHEMNARLGQKALGVGGSIIPYKGISQLYPDLISGAISAVFHGYSPPLQSGQVTSIAVAGPKRWSQLPDVPTFEELGYDFNPGAPFVLYARAGTPDAIIEELNTEAAKLAKSEEFAERVTKAFGIQGWGLSHADSKAYMDNEYGSMKELVDSLGIKPQ